jgi:hypothetical protein
MSRISSNVFFKAVVVVAGNVAVIAVSYFSRGVTEGVPNARASAVNL